MKKLLQSMIVVLLVAMIAAPIYFYFMGKQSQEIINAGLDQGHLKTCPSRPSCVSSTDKRQLHAIEALSFKPNAIAKLAEITSQMPNARIRQQSNDYLHVAFTSELFEFVDDVEFLMSAGKVEVRSVSRVGYSDLGVNRKRVEAIRAVYE